jgi:Lanthionine synthetase C-like protein/Protein kinase domain
VTSLIDIVTPILNRPGSAGWTVKSDAHWCYVRPPTRLSATQGWKLHVSATPLSAPAVLARSAEILIDNRVAFKFAGDLDAVARLVSRRANRGAGGKFITVYPETADARLRELAEQLHRATLGLAGPGVLSDRPYRPGSLVYYRYGAFGGTPTLGNDGFRQVMLVAPDGSWQPDQRRAWYAAPPWAPPDPFDAAPPARPAPTPVLLNGRYLVRQAIRHSFSGGVYRADDEQTGNPVIVKQARPHTAVGLTGGDACALRRHEAAMLRLLAPTGLVPQLVEVFEQQGDLFLVEELLAGASLRDWVAGWADSRPADLGRVARELAELVATAHRHRLVLRDLNPNNVLVGEDGLRLIDLETLTPFGQQVDRQFTPGYEAPEARKDDPVDPAADLYSLGATLFYLVTGADPVLATDERSTRTAADRLRGWLSRIALDGPAQQLRPVILELLQESPVHRPDLPTVLRRLAEPPMTTPSIQPAPFDLDALIDDGIDYLLDAMQTGNAGRLWPTGDLTADSDPFAVQHGAAGGLAVLVRAYRNRPELRLGDGIVAAANWICRRITDEPRTLPGLYFGHAGTAWALLDAGQLLADRQLVQTAERMARRLPMHRPNLDVSHGIAGAGLAQLRFFEATGQPGYLDRAVQAADTLTEAAEWQHGLLTWPVPADFPSRLAGARHLGFAHGVAGIGTFLLAAGRASGVGQYTDLAMAAAATLAATAEVVEDAAYWPVELGGKRRTHWCSGSSGVASFLLRACRQTDDPRLRHLVDQAALAVHRVRWRVGPSQCHGLAGDADFLLDLAQDRQQQRFRTWAEECVDCIYVRNAIRFGRTLPPNDTGAEVLPDYGVGVAGVLAFLLRLRYGGPRLWLPDVLVRPDDRRFDRAAARSSPRGGGDRDGDRHPSPADIALGRA